MYNTQYIYFFHIIKDVFLQGKRLESMFFSSLLCQFLCILVTLVAILVALFNCTNHRLQVGGFIHSQCLNDQIINVQNPRGASSETYLTHFNNRCE